MRVYLSGPQIEIAKWRQFDEMMGAGTGHLSKGQTEALQIAERAAVQQFEQVVVRRSVGQRQLLRTALLLLQIKIKIK